MNYYGAKELAESFRTVRKNTIQVAEDIPENQYGFRPAAGTRTVAEQLAHIAMGPAWAERIHRTEALKTLEGFDFFKFFGEIDAKEKQPRTKGQLIEFLRKDGEDFAAWLEGLSDAFLGQRVEMPASMNQPAKTRFEMLMSTKEHEMHCRGQLMVVERMLGIGPHLTRRMEEQMASMQQQQTKAGGSGGA